VVIQLMADPTFAICLPLYRPEATHLDELLGSLARQTVPITQLSITDDAPNSQISELIDRWRDRLPISYAANDHRLGMVGNWNRSIERSDAAVVTLTGQDDAYEPEFVARILTALAAEPDLVAVSVGRVLVDHEGEPSERPWVNDRSNIWRTPGLHRLDHGELLRLVLRNGNALGEPSCMAFRREAWETVGGFSSNYEHAADADFGLRIARQGPVACTGDPLVRFRRHSGTQTSRNRRSGIVAHDRRLLWTQHFDERQLPPDDRGCEAAMYTYLAMDLARALRWRDAKTARATIRFMRSLRRPALLDLWRRARELLTYDNLDAC